MVERNSYIAARKETIIVPRSKPVYTCDCETDPFKYERVPSPFIWGLYDGRDFETFKRTEDFVERVRDLDIVLYAHNGGKFDFMFLIKYVIETRAQIINNRLVSLKLGSCELRDSYSIIPVPLKEFGNKKDIDMWKLEATERHKYEQEINEYLMQDCVGLWNGVTAYREAAGRMKTIASNALAFSRKLGVDMGTTNHRFDCNYRPFYFGGRTECLRPGSHKNLAILDIRSSYPYAMKHDHPTGSEFRWKNDLDGMTRGQTERSFIVLTCTSKGAFPLRSKGAQGLFFPHEYNEYRVTGWEYLAAKELDLISDETISSVRYTNDTINFGPYVEHWFKFKSAKPKLIDPINYTIGKIMLNSLYGKASQNPARYYDYKIVFAGTPICREPLAKDSDIDICKLCGERLLDHGWELGGEFDGHEIHRRESLWKWRFQYGIEWKGKNIYKNVATGASITGFARANLLRGMHAVGYDKVIYVDTDSIICKADADIQALGQSTEIGDWELEEACAPIGHFAGKKLYAIRKANGKEKLASKGAKLTFNDVERIANGETITWENTAPTFHIDGTCDFVVRNIRRTSKVSP